MSDELQEPTTWYVDDRLESIEQHLTQLGLNDETIERFVEYWNAGDEAEKARLYALGDARLLGEVRTQNVEGADVMAPAATDAELVGPERWSAGTGEPMTPIVVAVGEVGTLEGDGTGEPLPPAEEDTEALEIIEGPVDQVLAWVGGDQERARRALDAEMMMEDPRKTLTTRLAKMAAF